MSAEIAACRDRRTLQRGAKLAIATVLTFAFFSILTTVVDNTVRRDHWHTTALLAPTPFNTYSLQAERWWQGHLDLGQLCDSCQQHLYHRCQDFYGLELARFNGQYFNSFPPVPTATHFLLYPIFGLHQPDRVIGLLYLLTGAVFLALFLMRHMNERAAIFWAFFAAFGSNFLPITVHGGIWYLAQNMAFMFCCLALWAIDSPKPKLWPSAFLFWALAVGCRPFQAIYLPLLVWWLWRNCKQYASDHNDVPSAQGRIPHKIFVYCIIPVAVVAIALMSLNFARFGNPLEFGHNFLPEMLNAPYGQFSWRYAFISGNNQAASNLAAVLRLPNIEGGQLIFPAFDGFFFPLANPIFIAAYASVFALVRKQKIEDREHGIERERGFFWMVLGLSTLQMLLFLFHTSNGGWHFGVRYFADAIPFLVLLILARKKTAPRIADMVLFVLAISLQIYGTLGWLGDWWR
ncbi:MAG: hypothetical protein FWE06_02285 [Oscillospiraceae bacterium]|nr:hypothetical protein [Oscillospiraceae bacterium]